MLPTTRAISHPMMILLTTSTLLSSIQFVSSNDNSFLATSSTSSHPRGATTQHSYALAKAYRCCQKSPDYACREKCEQQFRAFHNSSVVSFSAQVHDQVLEGIESSCGKPFIVPQSEYLWHCMLNSHFFKKPSQISKSDAKSGNLEQVSLLPVTYGLNSQKWVCCERAKSAECRALCQRTYLNDWLGSWGNFQETCVYAQGESRLRQCLEQSTPQTCAFGCQSKLNFCSFFFETKNNISSGEEFWFRDCNTEADAAALATYQEWLFKGIVDHLNADLVGTFANHAQCQVDPVRVLACAIHLKPCRPEKHSTEICILANCRIQSECIDWYQAMRNVPNIDQTFNDLDVPKLCLLGPRSISFSASSPPMNPSQLTPTDEHRCYITNHYSDPDSLATDKRKFVFFETIPATPKYPKSEVKNACYQSQCSSQRQLCTRNDQCTWTDCGPSQCHNVCKVGKLKEVLVPVNNYYVLPKMTDKEGQIIEISKNKNTESEAFKSHHNCYHLCRCDDNGRQATKCFFYCLPLPLPTDQGNGVQTILDRITCMTNCRADVQTCSSKCNSAEHLAASVSGKQKNKEEQIPIICSKNGKCIIEPETQLISLDLNQSFVQHWSSLANICQNRSIELSTGPVCDNKGQDYGSLCNLYLRQQQLGLDRSYISLAYLGKCQIHCSPIGEVCGRDGRTYKSECAANFEHVLVDRYSICGKTNLQECRDEELCPSTRYLHNVLFSQCPFCGSISYFYYDSGFFDKMSPPDKSNIVAELVEQRKLRVTTMAKQLNSMLTVAQCQLYAHLVGEGVLAVLVKPDYTPDKVILFNLHRICQQELLRLTILIKNRSPPTTTLFPLSLLRYNQTLDEQLFALASNKQPSKSDKSQLFQVNICIALIIIFISVMLNTYTAH